MLGTASCGECILFYLVVVVALTNGWWGRPRSFVGGDLHWIWKPYEIYQNVDLVSAR